ncbi:hydrogenase iron-sulfur subunit [Chloroflexota bacterium]
MPDYEPKFLVLCCNWCSYAGADLAGVSRLQMPPGFRIIRVMCSSRVKPEWIIRALMSGLDGVMVLGCHPGDCHYQTGNYYARRRMAITKKLLEYVGVEPQRVQVGWVSASENRRFTDVVTELTRELVEIGPNLLFAERKMGD